VAFVHFGHFTFDGNGNFSGAHDTNFGGGLLPHVDSGTYSVNSDCTTGTISFASGAGIRLSIVITSGGQEIKFVGVNTGIVESGTLRLTAASCSANILSGNSYGYSTHGLFAAGGSNSFPRVGGFVPFEHGGQISFGADGSISGADNANFGGVLMPGQPIAGTYSVNSDYTGTTTTTIAGVDSSWHFVILKTPVRSFLLRPQPATSGPALLPSFSQLLPILLLQYAATWAALGRNHSCKAFCSVLSRISGHCGVQDHDQL
jgi:hypothetical protein